ncbi:MAG: hypothetical protein IKB88_02135 [Clostridia bacterium]|nr:hypothetical protein [Clostridia bacterium]
MMYSLCFDAFAVTFEMLTVVLVSSKDLLSLLSPTSAMIIEFGDDSRPLLVLLLCTYTTECFVGMKKRPTIFVNRESLC